MNVNVSVHVDVEVESVPRRIPKHLTKKIVASLGKDGLWNPAVWRERAAKLPRHVDDIVTVANVVSPSCSTPDTQDSV